MILQSGCTNKLFFNNGYTHVGEKYHLSRRIVQEKMGFSGNSPNGQQAISDSAVASQPQSWGDDSHSESQCSHLQNGANNLTSSEGCYED